MWRKPGAIQNAAACASCHSPDGIELAEYGFDDADITRRAMPHLGPEDSKTIVEYIHALRANLHLTHLRNANLDRPLQPGGSVLKGASAPERDLAFGRELETKLPRLFGPPIQSVSDAVIAERQVLAVSPVNLRIGIPLSRLSEDIAHGVEHASISQWLPEEPPPIPSGQLNTWYAAEDAYLKSPSEAALLKLETLHGNLVNVNVEPGLAALSTLKFRSLLILQDRMRKGTETMPVDLATEMKLPGSYNVLWAVGDLARDLVDQSDQALQLSPEMRAKKTGPATFSRQLHDVRISWFWLGWLSDQGLFKTSPDVKTKYGMWLSQSLSQDGPYPFHNVFANLRRQAVVSNDPQSWGETQARRRRIWDMAGLRSFRYYYTDLPKDPAYRQIYSTFTANAFRMNLLLLKQSILQTHQVWIKISTRAIVNEMTDFIKYLQPATSAATDHLERDLDALIDKAEERR